jgi:two-component system, cell cycle sensor histidine kinase and response regulator CckA
MITPRKQRFVPPEKTYDLTDEASALDPRSVLMLEDNTEFAETLQLFLEAHSFQVLRVANGVEGLRQIMAKDFDAILCDLVMPNLPGDMFYLAVERTKPHLCKRFIFMSGHQADPKWDTFIRKVRALALWKPFPMADLLAAIQTVLAKTAPESHSKGA